VADVFGRLRPKHYAVEYLGNADIEIKVKETSK